MSGDSQLTEYYASYGTMTFYGQADPIPLNVWRLFTFYIPEQLIAQEGWTDADLKSAVLELGPRAGVAMNEPVVSNVEVAYGGQTFRAVLVLGENRWNSLTPRTLRERTGMLNAVSNQAVGPEVEEMMDDLNIEITPVILSTPESVLPANNWFAAQILWADVALSEQQVFGLMESEGMSLYPDVYKKAGTTGAVIYFGTGAKARLVKDITELLDAKSVLVNLAAGKESWFLDWAVGVSNTGKDIAQSAADLGSGLAKTVDTFLGISGALVKGLRYALYAVIPVAGAYVGWRGYRWWKAKRKTR